MSRAPLLMRRSAAEVVVARRDPADAATRAQVATIVEDVARRGARAVREHGERFGDLAPGAPLVLGRAELGEALALQPQDVRALLQRTADRITNFARAQRAALLDMDAVVPGGRAGHRFSPVERAGCYAPGGRFPLPSSVLMTAVTARVAGVSSVVVASPRPDAITCAAAAVAGADALLAVGGAQAIAALAYGIEDLPPVDVIVGPGNRYVTAAKQLVFGRVGIDMLAGPSELLVLADETADPDLVAADLLAQAEHDPDALPMLVSTSEELLAAVDRALRRQLTDLPTAPIARAALRNGFCVLAEDLAEACLVADRLAPEHLEVVTSDPDAVAARLTHYGALFLGSLSAEVAGDYGAGPNHVLPTGGTARFSSGLSVLAFLRVRTYLCLCPGTAATSLLSDAASFSLLEGLTAHARAAQIRF